MQNNAAPELLPQGQTGENYYVQRAKSHHTLYSNPYLQNPEAFSRISQRMDRMKCYFQENQMQAVSAAGEQADQHTPKAGIESRHLDVPFTALTLIRDCTGAQHFVFREHFFTEHREAPSQGQYHKHDFIELFFVIEGSFQQILLGEKRKFSAGEVVITDKNCEHADLFTEEPGTVLFLWIQSDFLDHILKHYDSTDNLYRFLFHALREQRSEQQFLHLLPEKDSAEIEYILEQLVYEDYKRGPGFQEIIKWNLLRLFHLLCAQYTLQLYRSGQESKERILLYEIERYIGLHLADVTILDLEAHFHYHRNYYNLLLRKYLGKGFREYVQELRMDQAAKLLSSGEVTVKQVAEQVGYENSSFFYHLFERHFQMGPLEYRNRHA